MNTKFCKDCVSYGRPKCLPKDIFTARKNTCDDFKINPKKVKKNVKKDEE